MNTEKYLPFRGEEGPHYDDGCCIRCGKRLTDDERVWLELDQRIDEYHDFGGVPDNETQGWFEFGADCAKVLRQRARAALDDKITA